jgi:hypothetical protein
MFIESMTSGLKNSPASWRGLGVSLSEILKIYIYALGKSNTFNVKADSSLIGIKWPYQGHFRVTARLQEAKENGLAQTWIWLHPSFAKGLLRRDKSPDSASWEENWVQFSTIVMDFSLDLLPCLPPLISNSQHLQDSWMPARDNNVIKAASGLCTSWPLTGSDEEIHLNLKHHNNE